MWYHGAEGQSVPRRKWCTGSKASERHSKKKNTNTSIGFGHTKAAGDLGKRSSSALEVGVVGLNERKDDGEGGPQTRVCRLKSGCAEQGTLQGSRERDAAQAPRPAGRRSRWAHTSQRPQGESSLLEVRARVKAQHSP